jgi:hypothetical protein
MRALRSTGSSGDGVLGDGPEHDGRADFGLALLPGLRSFRPSGLFVAGGGSECPPGPCYAAGSATSCGEAGCFFLPVEAVWAFPGIPSCSFLFSRGVFRDCAEVGHRAQGAPFAQVSDLWHWSG